MEIDNLNLSFKNKPLLQNITFSLKDKKTLAIIGKSGSGKSLLVKSLLRLLNQDYKIEAKKFKIDNFDILNLKEKELRKLRSLAALVLQDAHLSLYPYLDIGELFHIVLKTHTNLNKISRKQKAFYYLDLLGLKNLDLIWHSYPHQLSVGMARRISFALALVSEPKYLICDEINSSLDKKNEEKIIKLLYELKDKINLIIITHNLKIVYDLADELLIMHQGLISQKISKNNFFKEENEYTKAFWSFYATRS
ncbi:ABC transporter ATP-binding protein [Campylobacter sp. TTU-622]|uniref:ATP-binding cassette domain-containing protein n=1 Tax=unclassified Campylobacter TaxID=2593542 RepID=UPI0019087EB0|nr:ATP-binding cassette domain-containing protein [Campylobacter sp. TTU-622]MBK1973829.1 ABC transporter ATP-binding protein [Campylobacter sp. TTU-622]MBK1991511.1 ABC transporter ATP-binding protein [Campylobacter sp. 2018MI34]